MNRILVMKFGGTSVGNVESLNNAVRLVARERDYLPLVVSSALSKVTDMLVRLAEAVGTGNAGEVNEVLAAIKKRHLDFAAEVLDGEALFSFHEVFFADFGLLSRLCRQLVSAGLFGAHDRDHLLSFGERFGSRMFAIKLRTLTPRAHWCDAHNFMITNGDFGNARPEVAATREHLNQWIEPLLAQGRIVVTQGFVGTTPHGFPTTLGRGGSDFTATYLGSILPAANIQIWTDVNGVYTADPNKDPDARLIPELALAEAYRMARGGAKVLYAPCLLPLWGKGIPLEILNTSDPDGERTRITGDHPERVYYNPHQADLSPLPVIA